MKKRILSLLLCASVVTPACMMFAACGNNETKKSHTDPEKIADYLYYMEFDEYTQRYLGESDDKKIPAGCSCARSGDYFGRNLDLFYSEVPEFVIHMKGDGDRFESIGVCADPDITSDVSGFTEDVLSRMPDITNDGINENGVVISVNVVNSEGVDGLEGTNDGKTKVGACYVVRYLLDRAKSAAHAVELLGEVDIVGGFEGYGLHWMIADEKDTFVAEIINGELTVSKNEYDFMTNFYLNLGKPDGAQTVAGIEMTGLPKLNDYAIGVERWCILRDGLKDASSVEGMTDLMHKAASTNEYTNETDPEWFSECCGTLSIHDSRESFEDAIAEAKELYKARDRKAPNGTYITWHTSVYDIENRALYLYSQEDYSERYEYGLK